MDIIIDPVNQCVVVITPGTPLNTPDGVMQRATAECSRCGVLAAGNATVVIEIAAEHA